MTGYLIEEVPMPPPVWDRRVNPITATLRQLEVGQSVLVAHDDPNWRPSIVRNLNTSDRPKKWFEQREPNGTRIFRCG